MGENGKRFLFEGCQAGLSLWSLSFWERGELKGAGGNVSFPLVLALVRPGNPSRCRGALQAGPFWLFLLEMIQSLTFF